MKAKKYKTISADGKTFILEGANSYKCLDKATKRIVKNMIRKVYGNKAVNQEFKKFRDMNNNKRILYVDSLRENIRNKAV